MFENHIYVCFNLAMVYLLIFLEFSIRTTVKVDSYFLQIFDCILSIYILCDNKICIFHNINVLNVFNVLVFFSNHRKNENI